MGLDMYLYAGRSVSKSSWGTEESEVIFNKIKEAVDPTNALPEQDGYAFMNVTVKVGYWRKENAIHNWFVQNIQDGEDDCKPYYVSRESLTELKSLCEQVLADQSLAETLIPTGEGFFFGGTEYDEWYFTGLTDTIKIIDACLNMPEAWDFEYQSSW
jgi:hypothetical protein